MQHGRTPELQDVFPTQRHLDYFVNWSSKWGYIYYEIPKVGCTTIKRMLQLAEVNNDEWRLFHNIHHRAKSPLMRPSTNVEEFLKAWWSPEFLRFVFVRNPYTRTLSAYLDKIVINQWERTRLLPTLGFEPTASVSFIEFLSVIEDRDTMDLDMHWAPQTVLLGDTLDQFGYVGRFESFTVDLSNIARQLGIESYFVSLRDERAHATGANSKVLQYFGPEEKQIVQKLYADDFRTFDYSLELPVE